MSKFLVEHDCNIIESQQFDDLQTRTFFTRVEFEAVGGGTLDLEALHRGFTPIAAGHGMRWRLLDAGNRQRVLIMVSKYGHCLNDLLFRARNGRLKVDPVAVVSNHPDLGILADNYDVPFRHIPVAKDNKPGAEAELLNLVDTLDVQLVILARYMQILSEGLCDALEGKASNIHHSMLPAFKGARPYYQVVVSRRSAHEHRRPAAAATCATRWWSHDNNLPPAGLISRRFAEYGDVMGRGPGRRLRVPIRRSRPQTAVLRRSRRG